MTHRGAEAATGWMLAFHIGSLGDTLVTVPALRFVRAAWPDQRLALLCNRHPDRVTARQILEDEPLVEQFIEDDAVWQALKPLIRRPTAPVGDELRRC